VTWVLLTLMLGQDLGSTIANAARNSVKYVGYEVPMHPGHGTVCGWNGQRQSKLMLDGPRRLRILFQVDHGKVNKMLLASEDCEIEPGTQSLVMLPGITPADSISYLAAREDDSGIYAISLHADPKATEQLIAMARDPKNAKRQKKAFFWLARSKDPGAERFIEQILR
jgi:hypothetical protein